MQPIQKGKSRHGAMSLAAAALDSRSTEMVDSAPRTALAAIAAGCAPATSAPAGTAAVVLSQCTHCLSTHVPVCRFWTSHS